MLHEDLRAKQKDLDFIANQQSQILETISSLRETMGDPDGTTSSDLDSSHLDSNGKRLRHRTPQMYSLSESAEEES